MYTHSINDRSTMKGLKIIFSDNIFKQHINRLRKGLKMRWDENIFLFCAYLAIPR